MSNTDTYYIVAHKNGRIYSESPEEQGRGDGPRLVRLFRDPVEAQRYHSILEAYNGERLKTLTMTLREIDRSMSNRPPQGLRVAICGMPPNEWPRIEAEITLPQNRN